MSSHSYFHLSGVPQYVVQKAAFQKRFFYSVEDYQWYLDSLLEAAEKFHCRIHAYVLMPDYVHLLITPSEEKGVDLVMKHQGEQYAAYINQSFHSPEGQWDSGFKSILIDAEHYLLVCMGYIELAPVRNELVKRASDYRWSSHQCNAGSGFNALVDSHPLYLALGDDNDERCSFYRNCLGVFKDTGRFTELTEALRHEELLGGDYFKDRIDRISRCYPVNAGSVTASASDRKECYFV